MLLVIANFAQLSSTIIPSMLLQLENAFGVTFVDDRQVWEGPVAVRICNVLTAMPTNFPKTLMNAVKELDKTLFEGYIKPKAGIVTSTTRNGILDPGMDWYDTPQPTGE